MSFRPTSARAIALAATLLLAIAAVVALAFARGGGGEATARADGCPPGWTSREQRERLHAREVRYERLNGEAAAGEGDTGAEAEREREGGEGGEGAAVDGCVPRKHPESVGDIAAIN